MHKKLAQNFNSKFRDSFNSTNAIVFVGRSTWLLSGSFQVETLIYSADLNLYLVFIVNGFFSWGLNRQNWMLPSCQV